jgi:hypothetical protein
LLDLEAHLPKLSLEMIVQVIYNQITTQSGLNGILDEQATFRKRNARLPLANMPRA